LSFINRKLINSMTVFINQEEKTVSDGSSLSLLLQSVGIKPIGVAIAVNQTVVPKDSWDKFMLSENDQVMLIRATQGG